MSAPAWARWLARSPRKWMIGVYLCWAAAMLVACSVPGNWEPVHVMLWVFAGLATGHWVLHALVTLTINSGSSQVFAPEFWSDVRRWAAWPLILSFVAVLWQLQLPLYARFLISLPWLNGLVERAKADPRREFDDQWVGLYYVDQVLVDDDRVSIRVNEEEFLIHGGFHFYFGRARTAGNQSWFWQRWYTWSFDGIDF